MGGDFAILREANNDGHEENKRSPHCINHVMKKFRTYSLSVTSGPLSPLSIKVSFSKEIVVSNLAKMPTFAKDFPEICQLLSADNIYI